MGGVYSAMNQECQDVADQNSFAEGNTQHLGFAQTKALTNPLDGRRMPKEEGEFMLQLL